MAQTNNTSGYKDDENIGRVQISDEVVAVIAGIAATEANGVESLVGNMTTELISKMGIHNLSKGIKLHMMEDTVAVTVTVNLSYGCSIPKVCKSVQEKVSSAVETMTGLMVAEVNVVVADITIKKN